MKQRHRGGGLTTMTTAPRAAEEAPRTPAYFVPPLFEACRDAALLVDGDGNVLRLNSAARSLFGEDGKEDDVEDENKKKKTVDDYFRVFESDGLPSMHGGGGGGGGSGRRGGRASCHHSSSETNYLSFSDLDWDGDDDDLEEEKGGKTTGGVGPSSSVPEDRPAGGGGRKFACWSELVRREDDEGFGGGGGGGASAAPPATSSSSSSSSLLPRWARDRVIPRHRSDPGGGGRDSPSSSSHSQSPPPSLPPFEDRDGVGFRRAGGPDGIEAMEYDASIRIVDLSSSERRNGVVVSDEPSATTTSSLHCAVIRDVSTSLRLEELERTVAEQSARIAILEKDRLRERRTQGAIVAASGDSTIFIDEDGMVLAVDRVTQEMFGYDDDMLCDLLGRNINVLMGDDHASKHDSYMKRYLTTGERKVIGRKRELNAKKRDGSIFPISLGVSEVSTDPGEKRFFAGMIHDLSERDSAVWRWKETEADLKKEHSMLNGILEASFDAIFCVNERGIISRVNGEAMRQFGWTREEFLGHNISMIVGGGRAEHHSGYISRYLATGEKRVMGKKRELVARRKDGSEFFIELGLTEMKREENDDGDGNSIRQFCGFIHDLTAEKEMMAEVERKQRITEGVIDSSFDAMFTINERGIIQMANQAATEKFGWTKEELLGKNVSMICGGFHQKNHDSYIRRYLETGEKRVMGKRRELLARKKDGAEFTIELGLTEIREEGSDERTFCGFIKDISDHKALLRMQRLYEGF